MSDLHASTLLARTNVLQQGVSLPAQVDNIDIQTTFSDIPDQGINNIGDVMGRLAAYISFLEYQVSLAEADYEAWENHYDFEKKKILLTLDSARRDLMEAQADQQLEHLIMNIREKYTRMKLLKSLLDGKKRVFDALSRELSRRSLVYKMQGMGT